MKTPDVAIALGVGLALGYWAGLQRGRKDAEHPSSAELPPTPTPTPTPLGEPVLPPEVEPQGDAEPGTYQSRWDGVSFPVEVYPPNADETRISPPNADGRASAARDCSIIAVSGAWWDRAGNIATAAFEAGLLSNDGIARSIIAQILPECLDGETRAVRSLLIELVSRLDELRPPSASSSPSPLAISNPRRVPRRASRSRLASRTIGR